MRYKDIFEAKKKNSLEYFIESIKKDCQPFLSGRNGNWLYRGVKGGIDEIIINAPIFKNRHSGFTNYDFNLNFSNVMKANGFIATRINSLFCVTLIDRAANYNDKPLVIFPVGKVNYTWFEPFQEKVIIGLQMI